jgi:hypothetical protein
MAETFAFVSESQIDSSWTSTFTHPKSIKSLVQKITSQDFFLALSIGIPIIEQSKKEINNKQYKEALNEEIERCTKEFQIERKQLEERIFKLTTINENNRESLIAEYNLRITEIEKESRKLQENIKIKEFSNIQLLEQFELIKKTSESAIKSSIDEIVKQKEIQYEKELLRLQATNSFMLETLEKSARERVSQCDSQHKSSMEQLKLLYSEREAGIRKELEKSFASTHKGTQGEKDFDDLVKQYTNWPTLKNMSKTSHGTDRSCRIRKCDTLFEIKNYSSDVPKKEVEKFQRDMEENSDNPLGVFISLNTNITGKKDTPLIQVEWTSKSQLLLYINSFNSHSAEDVLNIIDTFADVAWNIFNKASEHPQDSDDYHNLQTRAEQAKVYVTKEIMRMTELLRTLGHDCKFLKETVDKQHSNYKYQITQSKTALQGIIEILLS